MTFDPQELYHCHDPATVTEAIAMEKRLWEVVLKEWETLSPVGHSYGAQVQRDVS